MYRNQVCFKVRGKYALFSDPITRTSGEKLSYQVPTYQALVGVCDSIYWKPTFKWVVDRVRVLKPIKTESRGVRPIPFGKAHSTLSKYTYLSDVEYIVEAHLVWNENRPDLIEDRNENKHFEIAKRAIKEGGRKDVFLGTRECQCYVEPCRFDEGDGYYDHIPELNLGIMFHSFEYENDNDGKVNCERFWNPVMENGIITFPTKKEYNTLFVRRLDNKKGE